MQPRRPSTVFLGLRLTTSGRPDLSVPRTATARPDPSAHPGTTSAGTSWTETTSAAEVEARLSVLLRWM